MWSIGDSNSRPIDCEPIALPAELIPHLSCKYTNYFELVNFYGVKKGAAEVLGVLRGQESDLDGHLEEPFL